jgi:glucose-1-phosphate cytidylyltransferase
MKAIILAGGRGTRLAEETQIRPKPMVKIGDHPIIWHIMKTYSVFGINDFVICLGNKGYMIKEYFSNYLLHRASSVTIDLEKGTHEFAQDSVEPWRITLVETGIETQTGGRLKRIADLLREEDAFCMTYGDGLADIDIAALVDHHHGHRKLATITTVQPQGRFGAVELDGDRVTRFLEKPTSDGQIINGGFFVLSPKVLDYVDGDDTIWERVPLENLARDDQLRAYVHDGFWQPMDTIREREILESLWATGDAPWMRRW